MLLPTALRGQTRSRASRVPTAHHRSQGSMPRSSERGGSAIAGERCHPTPRRGRRTAAEPAHRTRLARPRPDHLARPAPSRMSRGSDADATNQRGIPSSPSTRAGVRIRTRCRDRAPRRARREFLGRVEASGREREGVGMVVRRTARRAPARQRPARPTGRSSTGRVLGSVPRGEHELAVPARPHGERGRSEPVGERQRPRALRGGPPRPCRRPGRRSRRSSRRRGGRSSR